MKLQKQDFQMYAAKSSFFQKFDECITQKHYFSLQIHGFSSWHPYRGSEMEWLFCLENSWVRSRIFDRGRRFPVRIRQFFKKMTISLHTFENFVVRVSEIDTPIKDQTWSGCFVERIQGPDRGSSIGVQAWESMAFQRKVMILLDTFVNFLKEWRFRCRHSKNLPLGHHKSTPLSRIRHGVAVLSREFKGQIVEDVSSISYRHSSIFWKSKDFVAYIRKFCFWRLRSR